MTRLDAENAARSAAPRFGFTEAAPILEAELRYIELTSRPQPDQPLVGRDVLAWVVRFAAGAKWIDLAVEDRSGDVVRVERSR